MFKSIKSKIILITLSMFLILTLMTTFLAIELLKSGKHLNIENCNNLVSSYSQEINKEIQFFQEKASDLASEGEIFYKFNKNNRELLDYIVRTGFEENSKAIGGGIWFEPYKITPKNKTFCTYVFHRNGKLIIDRNFETAKYNYTQTSWYKEIESELAEGKKVVWTTPYIDSIGTNSYMTTVGVGIYDNENNFIGMSTLDWSLDSIIQKIAKLHPTKNSLVLFADKENDYILALHNDDNYTSKSLSTIPWYDSNLKNGAHFIYKGIHYISFIRTLDNGMILIVNVPEIELFEKMIKYLTGMIVFMATAFILLALAVYLMLIHNINKPVDVLIRAKEQIEFELKTAKEIQHSALPNIFPPYPEHKEFEIHASMDTAKEVGGDFYDFFFIDSDNFAFLVADVSGKGIPAAMFMMNTKTLIKNLAKTKMPINQIITKANKTLCKNNEHGFFVTAFLCIIELSTGKLSCVNAGHNPPLLRKNEGVFEYLKSEQNLVMGAIGDYDYKSCEYKIDPLDNIFLYTDGITEAVNNHSEFYGEKRLKEILDKNKEKNIEEILNEVKKNIDEFTQNMEQTDDITMLGFKYLGFKKKDNDDKQKIIIPADLKYLDNLITKVESFCDKTKVNDTDKMKLCVCAEELFVNIANYAYPPDNDNKVVEVSFESNEQQIELRFADFGTPYNPLKVADPDITLRAEERPVGGLGVFMVKNFMDSVSYTYENNKNVMTIKLKINS